MGSFETNAKSRHIIIISIETVVEDAGFERMFAVCD